MPERVTGLVVITYESPAALDPPPRRTRPPLSDDAEVEAEKFLSPRVSDGAWDGSANSNASRADSTDRPSLVDLATVRSGTPPFDLSSLRVPSIYVHGDMYAPEYYRALSAGLEALNPIDRRGRAATTPATARTFQSPINSPR